MVATDFYLRGSHLCCDGPAKRDGRPFSKMKVCFTCCDADLLRTVLAALVQSPECYFVKMSAEPKAGMFLGRCFFTTRELAGETWAKYKPHPRMMVNLQDDDFAAQFRPTET